MSYTRHYRETIVQHEVARGSVSYPASQNGGSMSVSLPITVHVPVDVSIHVDTVNFDDSVNNCGENVMLLTEAVVATEAATIISKQKNAKRVADTIINGFFSYVKSEISQQVSEITQNTDSLLMHLRELAKACLAKKTQMEGDYNRITSRYVKIFTDLNNELNNRIFQLDKPAFMFKKEGDKNKARSFDGGMVNIPSVFGAESSELQVKVAGSLAKQRAQSTITQAKLYLLQQKKLNVTLKHCMVDEDKAGQVYAPVCFVQLNDEKGTIHNYTYAPEPLEALNSSYQKEALLNQLLSPKENWSDMAPAALKTLSFFFNQELNKNPAADAHSLRVKEMARFISGLDKIKVNNS